jgi:hypothetical protein
VEFDGELWMFLGLLGMALVEVMGREGCEILEGNGKFNDIKY